MGAIVVSDLGKAYKQYPSRWSRLLEWLLLGQKSFHSLKWVIQNVSFTVNSGEAVGIIGINGAGKSTLLKMLAGTTQPTKGTIKISGKVAALLELGMGFHPDFTGRQNVYMAMQLLGYGEDVIKNSMPEIEAFAEIGSYIDQPVRVYSSGMQMRLAFSVATVQRPDVLIIDEALSVGDDYFQHKSFARIRQFRKQGTTLLIVSHDKVAIQGICDRAILISEGQKKIEGSPEEVIDFYNAMLADHQNQKILQNVMSNGRVQTVSGNGHAVFKNIRLEDKQGNELDVVFTGQNIFLKILVLANANIDKLVLGYGLKDRLGLHVFGTNTFHTDNIVSNIKEGNEVEFIISLEANLGVGSYSVQLALVSNDSHIEQSYEWIDLALMFKVVNRDKPVFVGNTWLEHQIEII